MTEILQFALDTARRAGHLLCEFANQQHTTRHKSTVIDLAHAAAGQLDGYWEKHLQPWDWAAGWLLVDEAGGTVTTLDGRPWSLQEKNMAARNGLMHGEMLNVFRHAAVGDE